MYIVRADRIWSYGASVSPSTLSATYVAAWLCDGRTRPIRSVNGSFNATITHQGASAAQPVNCVILSHTNFDEGLNVSIGGDIMPQTFVSPAATPPDDIPYSGVLFPSGGFSVTSWTLAMSGNSKDIIIGEAVAGLADYLKLPVFRSDADGIRDFTRPMDMDLASIWPYDPKHGGRQPFKGRWLMSEVEYQEMVDVFLAQRNGTRPMFLIPDENVNDARMVFMSAPRFSGYERPDSDPNFRLRFVDLEFAEVPRHRWPL